MQTTELSVIFPVRNIEREISGILRFTAAQTAGRETEFIVVDMGSGDRTVLEAVQTIKELKLRGFVIQNGGGTVSAALNTGIQKSGGQYLSFIFARRLYSAFLSGYLDTAARVSADFVFGSVGEEDARAAERRLISRSIRMESGSEYMIKHLRGLLPIDISAVLVRRSFLTEKQIRFSDQCAYGYAEEFVFRCMLTAECVAQSPTILKRDTGYELHRGKQKPAGNAVFQHADAVLRVLDLAKSRRVDPELIALLERQKLPLAVMNGVDVMLREGARYGTVREVLRAGGYDKLLTPGKQTENGLKRRILLWRLTPWLYKAK